MRHHRRRRARFVDCRLVPETVPSFDELVDLLRVRLRDADAIKPDLHSFKELMKDQRSVVADQWYRQAFDELEAQGHLDGASHRANGLRCTRATLGRWPPVPEAAGGDMGP